MEQGKGDRGKSSRWRAFGVFRAGMKADVESAAKSPKKSSKINQKTCTSSTFRL
jgi:hypothetical protein